MNPSQTPTKPCHNCRRQRLRCDRSFPHCNKCTSAGKECFGYGKFFRWTGAIASRGKLAGRTSLAEGGDDANDSTTTSGTSSPSLSSRTSPAAAIAPSRRRRRSTTSHGRVTSIGSHDELVASRRHPESSLEIDTLRRPDDGKWQLVPHSPNLQFELKNPWVLVDPLYQGVDSTHRHYLSYFTTRVCKDLVSHDVADRNPFRSLLPLTKISPLLQYIIVASSAAHLSNLVKAPLGIAPKDIDPSLRFRMEQASRKAFQDSLKAKHKALQLMHNALDDIGSIGADIVLAASLFFVNVELLESGKHGWKTHLQGAARIMSMLPSATLLHDDSLRDYLLSDCFIYFILASAFLPKQFATHLSYFQSSQIPFILGKAAANSYFCCPPEILDILYQSSQLSNIPPEVASPEDVAAAGLALIQRAKDFDLDAWAYDVKNVSYLQDAPIESRRQTGSAHRLAACLYTLQAIPAMSTIEGHSELVAALSGDIFENLSYIHDEDPNFKATTWPTFIAGAEAKGPEQQTWVMDRLKRLVVNCPWGFLYTAMEALQVIWGLGSDEKAERSWVQTLKDPDMHFLIV